MEWTRGLTIGRGSSATVSIATAVGSGRTFAVKSAEVSRSEMIRREQAMLSTLDCPHVIAQLGHDFTTENGMLFYNLFLEFVPSGSVSDEIRRRGGRLDECTIRSYMRKILAGLQYLHARGIVHCDIKCNNILVTADGPKIADFGCAKRVGDTRSGDWPEKKSMCGTPAYMAPEVARGEQQGFPADVWALGCTAIEMAAGRAPWAGMSDPVSAVYQIGFSGRGPEIPSFMSKQAQDFLGKCLRMDPMERWSASELLNHDFVADLGPATSNIDSPTSTLDLGLWNTLHESESGPTWHSTQNNSLVSPIERIRKLACTKSPDWELDDSWVTVRGDVGGSKVKEKADSYQSNGLDRKFDSPVEMKSSDWDRLEYFKAFQFVPTDIGLEVYATCLMPCICKKGALNGSSNFDKEIIICSLKMAFE